MNVASRQKLEHADKDLASIIITVDEYYPLLVIETFRGEARQNELFKKGATKLQWPKSKHNKYPSEAVDVSPSPIPEAWGTKSKYDWVKFYELSEIIMYEGWKRGIILRCGKDWVMNRDYKTNGFNDLLHIEIVSKNNSLHA